MAVRLPGFRVGACRSRPHAGGQPPTPPSLPSPAGAPRTSGAAL